MPKKFIIKKAIKKSKGVRKSVRVEIPRDPLITQLRMLRQMGLNTKEQSKLLKEAKASWVKVATEQKKPLGLTSKLKPLSSSPPTRSIKRTQDGARTQTRRSVRGTTAGKRLGESRISQTKLINQLKQIHKVDPKTGKRLFDAKTPYTRPQRKHSKKTKWGAGLVGGAVTAAAAKMRANKRRKNTRRSV